MYEEASLRALEQQFATLQTASPMAPMAAPEPMAMAPSVQMAPIAPEAGPPEDGYTVLKWPDGKEYRGE
ncbi:hypothetical protein T484DRAFT_1786136, partial [Baffinella frigidus]